MGLFKERLPKCERKFWKEFKKWKKRSRKHPDNTDVRNRVVKEWVTPFYTESLRGHAILQRRRRLMQPQSSKDQETPLESQESPPDYSAACGLSEAERAKEIRVLIAAFWESNRKLFRLIEDSPGAN